MSILLVTLMGCLLLSGCEKDKTGSLRLVAERLTGQGKTYVDSTAVGWVVGDKVRINGKEYSLTNDSHVAGVPISGAILAFHPGNISTDSVPVNNQVTVTIPSEYTYSTTTVNGDAKQKLDMPMVGTAAASATSIEMKHLCSAMEVRVTNGGFPNNEDFVLDFILLCNSSAPLSGTATVNLSGNVPSTSVTSGTGTVRMLFSNCTIQNNATLTVQIPVLPVATNTTTSVSVCGHLATTGTHYSFNRTTDIALERAKVHRASVTMTPSDPYTEAVFSVSSTQKVRFSPGNLQYDIANQTWSFMEYQYSTVETNSQNVGDNYASQNIVSLFGYGTSGYENKFPYMTSDDNGYYYYRDLTGDPGANYDWGHTYGNNWRTLTNEEWGYLFERRGGNRYLLAEISAGGGIHKGVILFPDGYNGNIGSYTYNNESYTQVSDAHWADMISVGAVFLPAAGERSGTSVSDVGSDGFYWSSSVREEFGEEYPSTAFCVHISNRAMQPSFNRSRSSGFSVRLVQNVISK